MNKSAAISALTQHGVNSPSDHDQRDSFRGEGGKTSGSLARLRHGGFPVADYGNTSVLPPLTTSQLVRETQDIVLRFPIKEMAEDQGATTRAVESQRNGESAMSLRAAVNMCRSNARARAMFARMIGIPGQCSDPDFMEGLEKVVDYYRRQQLQDSPAPAPDDQPPADLFAGIG